MKSGSESDDFKDKHNTDTIAPFIIKHTMLNNKIAMACPGQTGGLGNERDVQVTDSDPGHGVCVHLVHCNIYIILSR